MSKWIQKAIKHPGSLHRALHVPQGQKIPAAKMEKAAHSGSAAIKRKVALAKTLKSFHHMDGGAVCHRMDRPSRKKH